MMKGYLDMKARGTFASEQCVRESLSIKVERKKNNKKILFEKRLDRTLIAQYVG